MILRCRQFFVFGLTLQRTITNVGYCARWLSIIRPPSDHSIFPSPNSMSFSEQLRALEIAPNPVDIGRLFWWISAEQSHGLKESEVRKLCDLASTLPGSFSPEELTLLFYTCFEKMTKPHVPLLQSLTEVLLESRDLTPFPSICLVNILNFFSKRIRSEQGSFLKNPSEFCLCPLQVEFLRMVLGELTGESRLSRLKPQELFSVFYSASALGFHEKGLQQRLRNQFLKKDQLDSLTPRELSHLVYSMVKSNLDDSEFLSSVVQIYGEKVRQMEDLRNLGLVLFCLGQTSRIQIPKSIFKLLSSVNEELILSLRNEDLSCFFYALGKLGIKEDSLLHKLSLEVQKPDRMKSLTGRQILSILTAIKHLHHEDRALMTALSREVVVGVDSSTRKAKISTFRLIELCGILHTWSKQGHHKDWALQLLINEIMKDSRKHELCETSIGLLIHSIGLSSMYNPTVFEILQSDWLSSRQLSSFDDGILFMIINGLARLKTTRIYQTIRPVLSEFLKQSRIQNCSSLRLVGCLHDLATLNWKGNRAVLILAEELKKTKRIEEMSERCLSSVVYSLGKLQFTNHFLVRLFVDECLKPLRLHKMDNQGLSNTLLGLRYVNYPFHEQIKTIAWELVDSKRLKNIHEKEYIQLVHLVLTLSDLRIRDSHPLLDRVFSILQQGQVQGLKSFGISFLVRSIVQLDYRDKAVYKMLVAEAMRRDTRGDLPGKDLSMIFESIGKIGYQEIFADLVMWGLRDLNNLSRYTLPDLSRLLSGFHSMRLYVKRQDLVEKLEKEIAAREGSKNRLFSSDLDKKVFLVI